MNFFLETLKHSIYLIYEALPSKYSIKNIPLQMTFYKLFHFKNLERYNTL